MNFACRVALVAALACSAFAPPAGASNGSAVRHAAECVDGFAEGYACHNVDLLGHLDLTALGTSASSGNGNDMWGWTDPQTGKEYALVGLDNGTAFVDVSDPEEPVRLGNLPTHSASSLWRDIKTIGNYALVVSEAADHGLQVFDLTRLRNVSAPPVTFTEDAWYGQFGRAHNIVVDEQAGFAFAVGSRQGTQQCSAGLHMIDVHDPLHPTFAGCFGSDGYTHDAQCIVYDGPDSRYTGHEVCFAANEDTLTIVDVENKASPQMLSRTGYAGVGYAHQGWLTADRRHFLLDDELDEQNFGGNTRTYVFDVQDLTAPTLSFTYHGPVGSSDHNLYIRDGFAYESNYMSGVRILDLSGIDNGQLVEAAFFDTHPETDAAGFEGTWSNYPYFASGIVCASDINRGLFVLQPHLCTPPAAIDGLVAQANGDHRIDLAWNTSASAGATYSVERTLGGCAGTGTETIATGLATPVFSDLAASGAVVYGYRVRANAASGSCASQASACVEATTTGTCTAPPAFGGLASAASAGTSACGIDLGWNAAQPFCGTSSTYRVYRSTDAAFVPDAASLLADALAGANFTDAGTQPGTDYTYIVRAIDAGSGSEDANTVRLTTRATGPATDGVWTSGAEVGDPVLAAGDTSVARPGPQPAHVAWEIVDNVAHTGSRSYFSSYNNQECLSIGTGPLALTAGEASTLQFWTRYGIETGWDAGVVDVSTDDGQTWQTVTPVGGYPGNLAHTGNACGIPNGAGAYTGTNLSWTQQTFDLQVYSGQTVRLRWRFGTDTAQTDAGWWIDDIRLTHTQVPGVCTLGVDRIFADDFDGP